MKGIIRTDTGAVSMPAIKMIIIAATRFRIEEYALWGNGPLKYLLIANLSITLPTAQIAAATMVNITHSSMVNHI
jgi:hypothetical protein